MPLYRVCLVLFVVTLLGACTVKTVVPPEAALPPERFAPEIRARLSHGDWLVTRGIHITDNIVASATNMPFSHAAIYDADTDAVIEADGSGVHTTSLAAFVANSSRVMILRPMWSTPESAAVAVARARAWIGKGYNYTGLVGLDFPERYYCTQVAMEAYRPFIIEKPDNPIPKVLAPGRMHHWGRILFDTGP